MNHIFFFSLWFVFHQIKLFKSFHRTDTDPIEVILSAGPSNQPDQPQLEPAGFIRTLSPVRTAGKAQPEKEKERARLEEARLRDLKIANRRREERGIQSPEQAYEEALRIGIGRARHEGSPIPEDALIAAAIARHREAERRAEAEFRDEADKHGGGCKQHPCTVQ